MKISLWINEHSEDVEMEYVMDENNVMEQMDYQNEKHVLMDVISQKNLL